MNRLLIHLFSWPLVPLRRRRPRFLLGALILGLSGLALAVPPPAQAGVFDFLLGGRVHRGGRAPNRDKGGAVRSGRLSGGFDATIPYVITPRNTFQPTDEFPIRWNPVAGASTYTVRLWRWQDTNGGRQQVIWETTTADTSVIYPGDPALAPELFYSVEVVTDQGVSSDLDGGCAITGFAVLFPDTRAQLEADLAAIDPADLSPEEQALARSSVYLSYQMLDYAIATLADQLAQTPTATLYLALGDLYSYAGLNQLAIDHYNQALSLAVEAEDFLWQAIALEGIGEVNVALNQVAAALPLLQQAEYRYSLANQGLKADQIGRRLELLNQAQQLNVQPTGTLQGCQPEELDS